MNKEWDDFTKETHPHKSYKTHLQEIRSYFLKFLELYDFPDDIKRAIDYVIEFHDYGKLHYTWRVDNEKNPDHSPLSVKYLIRNKIQPHLQNKTLRYILWYLILKHHSSLSKIIKDKDLQKLTRIAKVIVKNLDFAYRINLIDAFGLFKISDVCSAENASISIEKPSIKDEYIKKIISYESGTLDLKRWFEQSKLSSLPNISILRAYTGWGKTDASLLFFKNKDTNKIFYLFPTITAINKFYKKLKMVFNENVEKYFYFYDTEVKDDLEVLQNIFFVENFMKPLIITTVDQFLLSFLQLGKYYRKRVMFRKAGIVFDEIHLLNPLMLKLTVYFLKKFNDVYDFKVLFMSATLPECLKKYLMGELNLTQNSFLEFIDGYKEKRRILFEYFEDDIENHIEEVIKEFRKNKKVMVVLNTVEKSISVAHKLVDQVGKENVLLIHARFMYRDRRNKEKMIEILKNKPHILVTTQVSEVSLDISYDFMFTELAPLSSLIQRFGRVNRYGNKTEEINVKIFTPKIEDKKHYPYLLQELNDAKEIIKTLSNHNLQNEFELLKALDELHDYDKFIDIVEKESKKNCCLEAFEEILQFFFSLDIEEDELMKILNYRDSFTTLIIPSPENIGDETTKEYVEKLCKEDLKNKSHIERKNLIAKFKEVSVPVPVWWIYKIVEEDEKRNIFPIGIFKDKVYNNFYGFIDMKGGSND